MSVTFADGQTYYVPEIYTGGLDFWTDGVPDKIVINAVTETYFFYRLSDGEPIPLYKLP